MIFPTLGGGVTPATVDSQPSGTNSQLELIEQSPQSSVQVASPPH